MTKALSFYLFIFLVFITGHLKTQVSFTLQASMCETGSVNVQANTGTFAAIAYSWAASPASPIFSAPSASSTNITFPLAGTYTVALGVFNGINFAYSTKTIVINPNPVIFAFPSQQSVCVGTQFTLMALSGASIPSFTFITPQSQTLTSPFGVYPILQQAPSTYTISGSDGICVQTNTLIIYEMKLYSTFLSVSPSVACVGTTATLVVGGVGAGATYTITSPSLSIPFSGYVNLFNINTHTINPSVTSVYSLMVDSAGCTNALPNPTVQVVRNPLPIINVSNNSPICETKKLNLSISGNGIYNTVWVGPNAFLNFAPNITIDSVKLGHAGIYSVTVTNTNGCTNWATTSVTILQNPIISVSNPSVCIGETFTLAASGASTYLWSGPSSFFSSTSTIGLPGFSVTGSYAYTVIGTANNSCTNTAFSTVNVNACTGITGNAEMFSDLKLFPNPVQNKLIIETTNSTDFEMELSDCLGKIILKQHFNDTEGTGQSLDFSGFSTGIYFLKLSTQDKQGVYKIIKE